MSKVFKKISNERSLVAFVLILCTCASSVRFLGEWDNFFTVIIGHIWSGQALYSFITGGVIGLAAGGGVERDANKYVRMSFGGLSLILYLSFFFWPW